MAPHSSSLWRHEASYILLFCLLITLVKPLERNSRYVDAVMTIPKGTLFSMCDMNLAFHRDLIGQATYFGLMGHGLQIGGYDDMWGGWCAKVICDHMEWGVNKEAIPFFQTVTPPRYFELAKQVKDKLGKVDPYFFKLSDGMVTWTQAWDELNNTPKLKYPKKKY